MGKHLIRWAAIIALVGFSFIRGTTPTATGDAIHRASVGACDSTSPDDVFKDRGLAKVGFLLIAPQEAEVHSAAGTVRLLKSKVVSESLARANMARAVQSASDNLDRMTSELASMDEQMEKWKGNTIEYNKRVEPFNAYLKQIKARKEQLEELKKKQGKIEDSQSLFTEAAIASAKQADEAMALYAKLAKDAALMAAIEKANKGAAQPIKLGPSGNCLADVAYLKKCAGDITAEGIPARMEGGVPVVEVTINGKKHEMIWDSGASDVSLSTETADELGLKATDADPTVKATIADGSTVECKQINIPSIAVGAFVAENVECTINPPGKVRGPDLLGGSFQRHFLCRLDQQAGVLHLTPIDKPTATEKPASRPSPAAAPTPIASPAAKPRRIDLLALVNPGRDSVAGTWIKKGARLQSDEGEMSRIQFPYHPPAEYDFRIEFSRTTGNGDVAQIANKDGHGFRWAMAAYNNRVCGFEKIDGVNCFDNATSAKRDGWFKNGKAYVAIVKVRARSVQATIDGDLVSEWKTDDGKGATNPFELKDGLALGILTYRSSVSFTKIEVVEISGQGKLIESK